MLRILRRRAGLILLFTFALTALGAVYSLVATRIYTASTSVLVGANRINLTSDVQAPLQATDNLVESQVEIIQSETIANRVVEKLKLYDNPLFNGSSAGRFGNYANNALDVISDWLPASWGVMKYKILPRSTVDRSPESLRLVAAATLQGNLKVARSARTYVITIAYSSPDRVLAAEVVNGVAEAFLTDQLEVQYDQTRRAAAWLSSRLEEMKQRVESAEREVEDYRASKNLTQANGRLIGDQQLQELDTQLTLARARAAETSAKMEQVRAIDLAGTDPGALPEVTNSEAVTRLKTQYSDVVRNITDLSNKYGSAHPLVQSAQLQLQNVKKLIEDEVQRIGESYKNDYEVAVARVASLNKSFNELQARNVEQNQALVRLRELEREASSSRTIYEKFLNRYKEMSGNEALPSPDARMLATATVPQDPSQPQPVLIMFLSLFGGAFLGLGTAFALEHLHTGLRTRKQVEDAFNVPFLALVPLLRGKKQRDIASYAVDHPLSNYAEAIRSIRMAIHFAGGSGDARVVAIASALPAEGKSTTALSLARYSAKSGLKTVLIDADMRRPTVTGLVAPHSEVGLAQVLAEEASLKSALIPDVVTSMAFLPCVRNSQGAFTAEMLASDAMNKLIADCRAQFDLVVIDVSPLIPVVDARALLPLVDKVILVVEWNKTSRFVVKEALQLLWTWKESILGIVLNKTDMRRVHHYEQYNSKAYANRYPDYYGTKR
jgi:succinoglycan biosynthesis transport protein ExoP